MPHFSISIRVLALPVILLIPIPSTPETQSLPTQTCAVCVRATKILVAASAAEFSVDFADAGASVGQESAVEADVLAAVASANCTRGALAPSARHAAAIKASSCMPNAY
jgi:hypothetical protein